MKNIINALNSENHSRIAKGLKKSLNKMGFSVSQTQASEAVSNTFGFPDLHSAQKHYATKKEDVLKHEICESEVDIQMIKDQLDALKGNYFNSIENISILLNKKDITEEKRKVFENAIEYLSKLDMFEVNKTLEMLESL